MRLMLKTLAFMFFGLSCGALGQFGYYTKAMDNPVILIFMLCVGAAAFVLLSDDDI